MSTNSHFNTPDVELASTWKWIKGIEHPPIDGATAVQPRAERETIHIEEYPHHISICDYKENLPTEVEFGHLIRVDKEHEEWLVRLFRKIFYQKGVFIQRNKTHEETVSSRERARERVAEVSETVNECDPQASIETVNECDPQGLDYPSGDWVSTSYL